MKLTIVEFLLLAQATIYALIFGIMAWQNRLVWKNLQANTYIHLFNIYSNLIISAMHNRALDKVFDYEERFRKKSVDQKVREQFYWIILDIFDTVFILYNSKIIGKSEWNTWVNWLKDWLNSSEFSEVFKDNKGMFTREFEDFLESLIKDGNRKGKYGGNSV